MKHFEQFSHKTFVQLDTVGEAAKKKFYIEEFDLLTKCKFFNTILLSKSKVFIFTSSTSSHT